MAIDAWLPAGFKIGDGALLTRVLLEGIDWQIYEMGASGRALIVRNDLASRLVKLGLVEESLFSSFSFGEELYRAFTNSPAHVLCPVDGCEPPKTKAEALAFATALKATRSIEREASLHDAIYAERISRLLPVWSLSPKMPDEVVLGTWLTGGVQVSINSSRRLFPLMGWLHPSQIQQVLDAAGFERTQIKTQDSEKCQAEQAGKTSRSEGMSKKFKLSGRPKLERFFQEHVIDIIEDRERYKLLGIDFPAAIVLHGPPGCGKTFATDRLVDYLGWPSFPIDSRSIGSPFIHETSRKIVEVFEKAVQNAPAVVVIDEMEAFLSERNASMGTGLHHVEEVAEFLRWIPKAVENQVLIIGMTNRIDMIDAAILRRGRFDHVIEVGMPSEEEVEELLRKLLHEIPCDNNIETRTFVKALTGRPLSDVAFLIREGARLAARAGRVSLDKESLQTAQDSVPPRTTGENGGHRIGFF